MPSRDMSMDMGNTIEHSIPDDILSPNTPAARPVRAGHIEHPTSPASARKANMDVPPFSAGWMRC